MTLYTSEPEGTNLTIEVSVRDHECEDGDRVSVRLERTDSWEGIFDGEIFNHWQTRYFSATVGYHYTILAFAVNGTGFKGNCSYADSNTGEMFVGYNDLGEYARWRAPGGDGSVGVINIRP